MRSWQEREPTRATVSAHCSPVTGTLCFVSARNLGDAVFHAEFLKALIADGFAPSCVVWTFPAARFLFQSIDHCEVVTSAFPMGATIGSFLRGGVVSFLRAAWKLRRRRPAATLELVSDVRERVACRLVGAPRHLTPQWEPGHDFRRHIRGLPHRKSALSIPAEAKNVYAAYDRLLWAMLGHGSQAFSGRLTRVSAAEECLIGVHPSASAACKLWPEPYWIALLAAIARRRPNAHFLLFGAAANRAGLEALRARVANLHVDVITSSLPEFRHRLAHATVLVGLDSFSVHLAHSLGVPSVVLVGANDPALFSPPSSVAVYRESDCPFQPCGGKPRCAGTSFQYACMKAIAPGDAELAIEAQLHDAEASSTPWAAALRP